MNHAGRTLKKILIVDDEFVIRALLQRAIDPMKCDLIRHFKTRCPGASVLVITGSLTPEERLSQVEDLDISDCIQKPFELRILQKAVYQALERTYAR